ncbi:MAG TPA: MMPL family transporter [Propionibacteriaceae bacterium]
MSSFLYGLGRAMFRRRGRVLLAWLGVLIVLGGLAGVAGGKFQENFSLPGTESQSALDSLARTFPQVSGTSAQIVVATPDGGSVRDADVKKAIEASVKGLDDVPGVDSTTSPYDEFAKGVISKDSQAAIINTQLEKGIGEIDDATLDGIRAQADQLREALPGSTVSVGGQPFSNNVPGVSITEGIGVVVAMIVLLFTLGSLRAAGMPLLTALLGVGLTTALILVAAGITTVSSTTPLLSLMLGLAVGIDYALFIVSRHRDQLQAGMEVEESVARSVATGGSAVVFAGMTVMIALCGLAVAGIPFLTVMGVAAAGGIAIAVLIALTLLPALLGYAGDKLRPKEKAPRAARSARPVREPRTKIQLTRRWVRLVTKVPVLTILIVVIGLGALAIPAKDLRIALPSDAYADPGTSSRVTYDLITEHFGVGFNGPLIVSANIVGSDDPLGVMDGIADELRALPGVASVPLATPNEDADTGIIQVIPTGAADSDETKELVLAIRALEPHFLAEYDVPVFVTGSTAVAIDISDRLGAALIPFGILVIGLSLILLAMVFRSVAVPIKASLGYLLSVGASFGATALVFEKGWFSSALNVGEPAPVISFLPILLMGILFGLAMDYEVFLVSRIREEYVHNGDPHRAIEEGFVASSRVVIAAAIIMFSVFAAFVPEGEGPIKNIGFGLAVGVFVDAFIVRMTLVPAVLALLGRRAWWLPAWLDRLLPSFDVEGEGLMHQVSLADWPSPGDPHLVYAEDLTIGSATGIGLAALPREVVVVDGAVGSGKTALLLTLAGRMRTTTGKAKVAGLVLPEQASAVRRRTGYLDCTSTTDVRQDLRDILAAHPAVIFVDHADVLATHDDRAALASLLDDLAVGSSETAVVIAVRDRNLVADLLPARYSYVTLGRVADLVDAPQN